MERGANVTPISPDELRALAKRVERVDWQVDVMLANEIGHVFKSDCLRPIDADMSLFPPNWRCNIIWETADHVVAAPVEVLSGNVEYPPEEAGWVQGNVSSGSYAIERAIVAAALRVKAYEMERKP